MNEPNPGSIEALEKGCKCPVVDNHYGKGVYFEEGVPQFWMSADCPIHSKKTNESKN